MQIVWCDDDARVDVVGRPAAARCGVGALLDDVGGSDDLDAIAEGIEDVLVRALHVAAADDGQALPTHAARSFGSEVGSGSAGEVVVVVDEGQLSPFVERGAGVRDTETDQISDLDRRIHGDVEHQVLIVDRRR